MSVHEEIAIKQGLSAAYIAAISFNLARAATWMDRIVE